MPLVINYLLKRNLNTQTRFNFRIKEPKELKHVVKDYLEVYKDMI